MSRFFVCAFVLLIASTSLFAEPVKRADLKHGLLFTVADGGLKPAFRQTRLEPLVGMTLATGDAIFDCVPALRRKFPEA